MQCTLYIIYFRYAAHRNLIGLGYIDSKTKLQINIPEEYWNTTQFRATLGHKLNHSFIKSRAAYNWATHPRYGWIRTVTAIDDIYKGDEIFINYHYPVSAEGRVPQWYRELYEIEVGPWPKSSDGKDPGTI